MSEFSIKRQRTNCDGCCPFCVIKAGGDILHSGFLVLITGKYLHEAVKMAAECFNHLWVKVCAAVLCNNFKSALCCEWLFVWALAD